MTAIPDRDQLRAGTMNGALHEQQWRMDVIPYSAEGVPQPGKTAWVPQAILVSLKSPKGNVLELATIRLHRGSGER